MLYKYFTYAYATIVSLHVATFTLLYCEISLITIKVKQGDRKENSGVKRHVFLSIVWSKIPINHFVLVVIVYQRNNPSL